jgi:N-methylhydantoinase A/oxoprolinase/acetone carboxylase beta subunit
VGGTTTDVAVLKGGRPSINKEGARVGGWLTRVQAAEITTIGLGGDSLIQVAHNGMMTIGPQRVFPLSWVASQHPHLVRELAQLRKVIIPCCTPNRLWPWFLSKIRCTSKLIRYREADYRINPRIPSYAAFIGDQLNKEIDLLPWQRLVSVGSVHRASLTPTDILHVTGEFTLWNCEAAELGVRILARRYRTDTLDLSFKRFWRKSISHWPL